MYTSVSVVVRRVRSWIDAHDAAGASPERSPHAAVDRAWHHRVKAGHDALVFCGIKRLIGFNPGVLPAVAVRVQDHWRPALRLRGIARQVEHLGVQPAHHRSAAARPERVIGVEAELWMVCRVTRVDERVLLRLRIKHGDLPGRSLEGEQLRGWMFRSLPAEVWGLDSADCGGHPHASRTVEHGVVVVHPRVPDDLVTPIRRRLERLDRRRMARSQADWHARITHGRLECGRRVVLDVQDRNLVRAVPRRSEQRAVHVHRRVPLVARDEIVQVVLLVHPVAERDDDVPLDALGAGRLRVRQLAPGDPVGPFRQIPDGRATHLIRGLVDHLLARLARLDAPRPGLLGRGERAEPRRQRPRGLLTELMAADAAVALQQIQVVSLCDALGDAAASAELGWGWNVHHRVPVDGGVVLGRGRVARGGHGGQVHVAAGFGGGLGAVDQPVAARPHAVTRLG